MDEYFDMEENMGYISDNISERTEKIKRTIKRSRKHPLTKIGKLTLFGPPIATLLALGIKLQGDTMLENYFRNNEIDEAITQASLVEKDELNVLKLQDTGIVTTRFNVDELLTNLKTSKDIYNAYNSKLIHSKKEEQEYHKAMNTILYSNDKLIEIYNELVKNCIAKQTYSDPNNIDILYNNPDNGDKPVIKVAINGQEVTIGDDLKDIIISYKEGLMLTYNLNYDGLPTNVKESHVRQVLDNIPNLRKAIKKLNDKDTRFIISLQPKVNTKPTYQPIENSKISYVDFSEPEPELEQEQYSVDYVDIIVPKTLPDYEKKDDGR